MMVNANKRTQRRTKRFEKCKFLKSFDMKHLLAVNRTVVWQLSEFLKTVFDRSSNT